jgi:signal transduction histidine kinase
MVTAAVTEHERSCDTLVQVEFGDLPAITSLSIRLTLYRILQEGLSNAYHHGGGIDERVFVALKGDQLSVQIADAGPGLNPDTSLAPSKRMGLRGMRDRVESLGGEFEIMSRNGRGTQIYITLPLLDIDDNRG